MECNGPPHPQGKKGEKKKKKKHVQALALYDYLQRCRVFEKKRSAATAAATAYFYYSFARGFNRPLVLFVGSLPLPFSVDLGSPKTQHLESRKARGE